MLYTPKELIVGLYEELHKKDVNDFLVNITKSPYIGYVISINDGTGVGTIYISYMDNDDFIKVNGKCLSLDAELKQLVDYIFFKSMEQLKFQQHIGKKYIKEFEKKFGNKK